jgi:hypothetical protein
MDHWQKFMRKKRNLLIERESRRLKKKKGNISFGPWKLSLNWIWKGKKAFPYIYIQVLVDFDYLLNRFEKRVGVCWIMDEEMIFVWEISC